MIEKLAQFTDIKCCLIVGGLSTKVMALSYWFFLLHCYSLLQSCFPCHFFCAEFTLCGWIDLIMVLGGVWFGEKYLFFNGKMKSVFNFHLFGLMKLLRCWGENL